MRMRADEIRPEGDRGQSPGLSLREALDIPRGIPLNHGQPRRWSVLHRDPGGRAGAAVRHGGDDLEGVPDQHLGGNREPERQLGMDARGRRRQEDRVFHRREGRQTTGLIGGAGNL